MADKADKERAARLNNSPLHGIPILIKDNIGTADLMQSTAGALALEDLKPIFDAEVVTRLREAGAIILGKASLSEWANFRGNGIPSGWNGRRGQTVSAYVRNQNPSGSSSGSGVSISANLAVISLGSETDGSIISPSTRNAIVGLKPTLGAVSTKGVIPLAFSNDVVGPMTRTVEDAAILMGVVSNIDLEGCDLNIHSCLEDRTFRIGIHRDPFWNSSDSSLPVLENCLDIVNASGLADVIDPVRVPFQYRMNRQPVTMILSHEFKYSLNNYLRDEVRYWNTERNRSIYTLADIIAFNEMNPPIEGYNQNILIGAEATNGLRNKTYLSALHVYQRDTTNYLDSIFNENAVDALATPCSASGTSVLYSYGAAAGYPSLSVPVGTYSTGLPFGLCLLGRRNSEPVLLKLGLFIEQSRPTKRPVPRFIGF